MIYSYQISVFDERCSIQIYCLGHEISYSTGDAADLEQIKDFTKARCEKMEAVAEMFLATSGWTPPQDPDKCCGCQAPMIVAHGKCPECLYGP